MSCVLKNFCHLRPRHEIAQEKILEWIAEAHARAARCLENEEFEPFRAQIRDKLFQLGAGKERIQSRGIHIDDMSHDDWEKMQIYPVSHIPHGRGFADRSRFYDREVARIFELFYPDDKHFPAHLVHVTCTGYVAPSPAQKIVSLRRMGMKTTVTHAYHMGCYASIPAIRIASGFASLPSPLSLGSATVDIVHTELCSLHMHPLKHSTEQLIVQSLFADGFIKYTLTASGLADPHLKIVGLHEEMISDSSHCMTWFCEDKGLSMTLSKEVPVLISRTIDGYLQRLSRNAGFQVQEVVKEAFFAIHPGGPKILQQIRDLLNLEPHQIEHSVQVLKQFGNMSSATLPHIWEKMLKDPKVPKKARIVSLAFGPGLNISGGLFEKEV
jgi:predicted naringenin-chalcone synthase